MGRPKSLLNARGSFQFTMLEKTSPTSTSRSVPTLKKNRNRKQSTDRRRREGYQTKPATYMRQGRITRTRTVQCFVCVRFIEIIQPRFSLKLNDLLLV